MGDDSDNPGAGMDEPRRDAPKPTRNELIESRINTDVAGAMQLTSLGVAFKQMGEVMEFAKMMAVSGAAVPAVFRRNPGACLAVTMKAAHLGFEPFSFASKCYFVNDQLAYEAQLISAIIINRAPFVKRPTLAYEGDGQARKCIVTLHFREPDGDMVYTSPTLSQITTKNSPLWKSEPDQQLAYYSVRAAARRYCPDVILGMYDPEELAAVAARDVTPSRPPKSTIADKLAGGSKPAVTYATEAATAAPETVADGKALPLSQETENGRPDEAAGQSAPVDNDPEGSSYERELIDELRAALDMALDPISLKVVADEFAGAMTVASEIIRKTMQAMIEKRASELG